MKKDLKKYMYNHSKAKVKLLEKYLEKYLNIISNDGHTKRIHLFDLFCGEGIYENNGEGSPLVILKALKNLHYLNVAKNKDIPQVDIYLNDKDDLKIEKLKQIINEKKLHDEKFGRLIFRAKDYKDLINNISKYITNFSNEKAFIFIDPYGYKDIRASELKKLLSSKKSEVLLFLPTQFMYRFDERGTPQALIEIIEELVDLKDWKQTTSVFDFINQFKVKLRNYFGDGFFVDTFTIQKDEATVFCLFFFSSHIRGFEKMLETKWQIDEDEGKGWKYESTGNLFTTLKVNELEEKLVEYIRTHNNISNGDVYKFSLELGFLPKHVVEVFTKLQKDNAIEITSNTNTKVRKGAFYISYDNFKNEYNKIYFNIK